VLLRQLQHDHSWAKALRHDACSGPALQRPKADRAGAVDAWHRHRQRRKCAALLVAAPAAGGRLNTAFATEKERLGHSQRGV
jgi:hypothetical protein